MIADLNDYEKMRSEITIHVHILNYRTIIKLIDFREVMYEYSTSSE